MRQFDFESANKNFRKDRAKFLDKKNQRKNATKTFARYRDFYFG